MFTGIVQGVARVEKLLDLGDLRTFVLAFPAGFNHELAIGASVAVDGVCLTVTEVLADDRASFDVMKKSLDITTLAQLAEGCSVNVERAARDGAEIGGHPLSGHVDCVATVAEVDFSGNNARYRFAVPAQWMKYIFSKGYIAINGASLTVADIDKKSGWFDVWLIPETRRMTVFEQKKVGDTVNIEIERATQVVVDTVRDAIEEKLGPLLPAFEQLLAREGLDLASLAQIGHKDK